MDKDELELEFEDDNPSGKKNDGMKIKADPPPAAPINADSKTLTHSQMTPKPEIGKLGDEIEFLVEASPKAPVTKIADVRAQQAAAGKSPPPAKPAVKPLASAPRSSVVGSSALKEMPVSESLDASELRAELKRVSFEAEVRVALAEYKGEFLADLLSDTKVMQLQIEQLLQRIHAKNPAMKQEVLMIKKILADFTTKKRK